MEFKLKDTALIFNKSIPSRTASWKCWGCNRKGDDIHRSTRKIGTKNPFGLRFDLMVCYLVLLDVLFEVVY